MDFIQAASFSWALDDEIMTPGRHLDHVLLEQAVLPFVMAAILLAMLGALMVAERRRAARGAASAPILLLPSWKTMGRILGFGVLLPLGAFYLYARWSGVAGREYSVRYLWPRFVLELVLLVATILAVVVSTATRVVRERCRCLGVRVPSRAARSRRLALWIALGLLWVMCLALRGPAVKWPALAAILLVPGFLFGYSLCHFMKLLFGPEEYGLFHGTVARSFIPIFAATAILLAAAAQPHLARREATLAREDPFLSASPETRGYSSQAVAEAVWRLRSEIQGAMREFEAGRE